MKRSVTDMVDIPHVPESVTVEWLTDILRRSDTIDSGTRAVGISWQKIAAGFTSYVVRFAVQYSSEVDAPDSFVGKFPIAIDEIPARLAHLVTKEVGFYQEIEDAGVAIPRCYFAASDDENHVFVLLEDLGSEDWSDQLISATPEQSEVVMKALAKLHAKWWNHADLADFSWLNQPAPVDQAEMVTLFQESITEFNTAFGDACPQLSQIGDMFLRFLQTNPSQLRSTNATGNRTLIHGDVRLGNIKFVGDEVVFFDWQLVGSSGAVVDLTYWLGCNYSVEDRRANEQSILRIYSDELKRHGVDYPVKKLKSDIRFQLLGRCLSRLSTFSLTSETLFATDDGRQFLEYDLQGLEGMLVDYKVLRYFRMLGFVMSIYGRIRRLFRL